MNVYIFISQREINVLENIKRKQNQMDEMISKMVGNMKDTTLDQIKHTTRERTEYKPEIKFEIPKFMRGE